MVSPTLSPMSSPNCKQPTNHSLCRSPMWRGEMECAIKVHDCCNSVGGSGLEEESRELKGRLERTNIQQTSRTLAMQWHRSINHMMCYVHSLIVTQYLGIESSCLSNDCCCKLYMHG